MQKVEEMKSNYKQCQEVLDCAEKRLQTNGVGVTTEGEQLCLWKDWWIVHHLILDLVATAKNVYSAMISAGSKANQTHKMVEVR